MTGVSWALKVNSVSSKVYVMFCESGTKLTSGYNKFYTKSLDPRWAAVLLLYCTTALLRQLAWLSCGADFSTWPCG